MEARGLLLLLVLLLPLALAQPTCDASNSRIDCQQYSQSTCVAAGCCWSEVNPNPYNEPWCFFANQGEPECSNTRYRVDCGYDGITQQECEQRFCCWNAVDPNPDNLPYCFFSNALVEGYQVTSLNKTNVGYNATLETIPGDPNQEYGAPISPLAMTVEYETSTRLHVKIYDPNMQRWEIPQAVIPRSSPSSAPSSMDYSFSMTNDPFGFAVTRVSTGEVLFNSSIPSYNSTTTFDGLQFKDQFLSLSTQLPTNPNIYGLEESTQTAGFRLSTEGNIYTLWNRDTASATTNQNLYGSHPFYMQLLDSGNAHGVLLLSSNGMDITINSDFLTYSVIGGVLDFYFFLGPTPDEVVQQYSTFIGLPRMQTYWSFGFHQSAYGMPNLDYVEQVVANYSAANIPLDTIWSDIDYMDVYKDWTWDPVNYPQEDCTEFCEQLHDQHQQYVVIVDPGIDIDTSYSSYNDLINSGGYIYDVYGNPFEGQVWPGYTIFPDFLNPAGQQYWGEQISAFLDLVPYDGLWIDMNEISNFCSGECTDGGYIPPSSTTCGCGSYAEEISDYFTLAQHWKPRSRRSYSTYYDDDFDPEAPPYAINNDNDHDPLNTKTLDMDAYHYLDTLEYDAHNLFGLTEAITTATALENYYGKRSFVLSRSTFLSSGHWTAHWSGDNSSVWPDLFYSIVDLLSFNLLAVPMIGSDICGFNGNTTEELCARWIETGAFYPFSRDHNTKGASPQELYRWPTVAEISAFILRVRYSMLPLYYTLMYHSSTDGSPIIRPLLFQFPADPNTYSLDTQFLVGDALMVAPVITEGATEVEVYFPAAVWYDFYTGAQINSTSMSMNVNAPLDFTPLYLLGGSIVSRHSSPQLTTYETRLYPFNLTVALDQSLSAEGHLFVDDGSSLDTTSTSTYVDFSASVVGGKGTLISTVQTKGYAGEFSTAISAIQILGVSSQPSSVQVNGQTAAFTYSGTTLTLASLSLDIGVEFSVVWM